MGEEVSVGLCYNSTAMDDAKMNDDEMRAMLIEYMGKGFLENIIALMKQDPATVRFIPDLLGDDTIMVRLGATALVEELVKEHRQVLAGAVPGLVVLLGHENPTIRGIRRTCSGSSGTDRPLRRSGTSGPTSIRPCGRSCGTSCRSSNEARANMSRSLLCQRKIIGKMQMPAQQGGFAHVPR